MDWAVTRRYIEAGVVIMDLIGLNSFKSETLEVDYCKSVVFDITMQLAVKVFDGLKLDKFSCCYQIIRK